MTTLSVSPKSIFKYAVAAITRHVVHESSEPVYKPDITQDAISHAFLRYETSLSPTVKIQLNGRLERGLSMARNGSVTCYQDPSLPNYLNRFWVKSSMPGKPAYLVDLFMGTCTYPDFYKGNLCKHRIAGHIASLAIQMTPQPVTQSQPIVPPNPVRLRQIVTSSIPITPPEIAAVKETTPPASPTPVATQTKPPEAITADIAQDSIIWGVIRHNGAVLGVEVLRITGEQVTIRALPKVLEGNKLQAQFPFDGKRCIATVPKEQLSHVRIFR